MIAAPQGQLLLLLSLGACGAEVAAPVYVREVGIEDISLLVPEVGFSGVREIVSDGDVFWVLDSRQPFVTRLSASSGDVRQFGAKGGGPSEFLSPWAMLPISEGIQVWDLGNRRVSVLSGEGTTADIERLSDSAGSHLRANIRDVSYADPFRVRGLGGRIVFTHYASAVDRTADIATGSLQWSDERLDPMGQLFAYSDHTHRRSGLREWVSLPFWDVCDGAVVVWSPAEAGLLWLDAQGRLIAHTVVAVRPRRITESDVEAYLRWMRRLELGSGHRDSGIDYSGMAARNKGRFAETAPVATDLRCESDEVAWIRMFETELDPLGRGRTWLRVERSGAVSRLRFPAEFTPFLFSEKEIVGVVTPSDGPQQLARWAMGRPRNF